MERWRGQTRQSHADDSIDGSADYPWRWIAFNEGAENLQVVLIPILLKFVPSVSIINGSELLFDTFSCQQTLYAQILQRGNSPYFVLKN